jgi:hypothetical protein
MRCEFKKKPEYLGDSLKMFLLSKTSRPLFSDYREVLPRGFSSPAALHLMPKLSVELYLHSPCVPS